MYQAFSLEAFPSAQSFFEKHWKAFERSFRGETVSK